jgi:hypothetical protein
LGVRARLGVGRQKARLSLEFCAFELSIAILRNRFPSRAAELVSLILNDWKEEKITKNFSRNGHAQSACLGRASAWQCDRSGNLEN